MSLPASELESRLQKVRELLTLKNLSCGLIYYDELNIANGWYLSGWCPQFESGAVLVPVQGEPMILGGPESEPFAQIDSAIKKTKNIPVFMVPEEEYPNAYISSFAEVFKEIEMNRSRSAGGDSWFGEDTVGGIPAIASGVRGGRISRPYSRV